MKAEQLRNGFTDLIAHEPSEALNKRLATYASEYITAYHVWQCFPDTSEDLASAITEVAFPDGVDFMAAIDGTKRYAQSIPQEVAQGVYTRVEQAIHKHEKDPYAVMFHLLKKAYVNVLSLSEERSQFALLAMNELAQYFGTDGYVDPRTATTFIDQLSEEEDPNNPLAALSRSRRLWQLRKQGITKNELQGMLAGVQQAEDRRSALHEEVLLHGEMLGLTADDVNAEILFNYAGLNETEARIRRGERKIFVHGGVLMIKAIDPETLDFIPEFRMDEYDANSENSYKRFLERKAEADRLLQLYLQGEYVIGPRYFSNSRGDSQEGDEARFSLIQQQFPKLPMSQIHEVYLCMHGDVCSEFRLEIDIGGIYHSSRQLEEQLARLRAALSELGFGRF